MSLVQLRGGVPHVARETVSTTGRGYVLPQPIFYLKIRTTANPVRIYFTEDDFNNDENYVLVPVAAAATPHGEWDGPVELPTLTPPTIWMKGDGGNASVELVGFQRRA